MDDTRDRGPGAALLEPEDEPAATHTTPRYRPGGQRARPTPRLTTLAELIPAARMDGPEAAHTQRSTAPSRQDRERPGRAAALRAWAARTLRAIAAGARASRARGIAFARRASAWLAAVWQAAPHTARRAVRAAPVVTRRAAERAGRWAWAHATPGRLIGLLACALSIGFYAWYAGRGLTLAYGDAITHMLIARRVLMSRTPGLAQFGTVWPPFTHILMLPFVWNETLFRSGLAGALPSMAAYVIAAVAMYRLGALAFSSRVAGVVAALTLMLNPDTLYMQSTPMTEMGLICCAVVALYYVLRWVREQRPLDLVKCAAAVAAGSLIRYDGWALAGALLLVVGYAAWRARGRWYAEASVVIFAMLAFAGCAAWFLYNQVIFGDALAFYRGPYSSEVQQQIIAASYSLPTRGNAWLSFLTYGTASLDSVGWVVAGLALGGIGAWLLRERFTWRALPLVVVIVVPFAFNWLSLYKGATTLQTPEFSTGGIRTYFNERFGMMMIPAASLFVGSLAGALTELHKTQLIARMFAWLKVQAGRIFVRPHFVPGGLAAQKALRRYSMVLALLPLVAVALTSANITFRGTPYALEDPLHGVSANGRAQVLAETNWLTAHAHGGTILAGYSSYGSVIFLSGFPDHTFITDSDGALFQSALAHPERTVTWIMMDGNADPRDPVWQALHDRQDWRQFYILRAVIGSTQIYERISTGGMT